MRKLSRTFLKRAFLFNSVLLILTLSACSSGPAVRSEKELSVILFTDLSPESMVSFTAGDNGEYTRRIATAAEKLYKFGNPGGNSVDLILHTQLQHWEKKVSGLLSKRYEIHLNGTLVDQDSRRIGVIEGGLEYRRGRFLLQVSDEAQQIDAWDQDFIEWSAGKLISALTSSLNI